MAANAEQRSGRLLVVDDVEMNRDMLSRRLRKQGYDVEVAENGARALEQLAASEFDLVLLDIMMPEMDGYEVLTRVKSDDALRHIPVIMISAVEDVESAREIISSAHKKCLITNSITAQVKIFPDVRVAPAA